MDLSALDPLAWILIGLAVLVVVAIVAVVASRKRKQRSEATEQLRSRFGAEYDRTIGEAKNRRSGEEDLLERERRRRSYSVRPVPLDQRERLRSRWDEIQSSFVDAPHAALRRADELLDEVAELRGYPDAAREQRLADLSVDHPAAVERYCSSRPDRDGDRSTEELRSALLASRDLLEAMISKGEPGSSEAPPSPFQELVEEEPATGEGSARSEQRTAGDRRDEHAETIDLTAHDRPREHVDTGGLPAMGPDGEPRGNGDGDRR